MKKLQITFVILLGINIITNAQTRFGVKGGINFASISLSVSGINITSDNNIGFHAGLLTEMPISEKFLFQPNLLYSVKGGKFSSTVSGSTTSSSGKYNYLEVPLNFLFKATDGFSIGGGPYLAYLLSATDDKGTSVSLDGANKFDYGVNLAANYEFKGGFGVSAFYAYGLGNLASSSSSGGVSLGSVSVNNRVFGFSVIKYFGEK